MTDPAVAAAERAYFVRRTRVRAEAVEDLKLARVAEAAAREAFKPIRELHHKVETPWGPLCDEDAFPWPCATALRIYRKDEL